MELIVVFNNLMGAIKKKLDSSQRCTALCQAALGQEVELDYAQRFLQTKIVL